MHLFSKIKSTLTRWYSLLLTYLSLVTLRSGFSSSSTSLWTRLTIRRKTKQNSPASSPLTVRSLSWGTPHKASTVFVVHVTTSSKQWVSPPMSWEEITARGEVLLTPSSPTPSETQSPSDSQKQCTPPEKNSDS